MSQPSTVQQLREIQRQHMREVLAMPLEELQAAILRGEINPDEMEAWLLTRMMGVTAGSPQLEQLLASLNSRGGSVR